ncbi:MAG: DUF4416 family protein [Candidatus Omnitrophica bacterium]|nr:DUF4416 family protein [Candidatus Omnitrophota bacterium]
MGQAKKHQPVKLIIGFIFREESVMSKVEALLKRYFGKIDFASESLSFAHTNYYTPEFGGSLKKKFISFQKLVLPERLSVIKRITNSIEKKFSSQGQRLINLDPGYLDLGKLVLASTKDYKHRIYLNKGIYAEITLYYEKNTFKPWDWTYPDYRTPEYINIFNRIREIYAQQIKDK